jgi:hypothetical protein
MKTASRLLLVGILGFVISAEAGWAQDIDRDEYAWMEAGAALVPDFDARLSGDFLEDTDVKLSLDPGFAVNGGIGERFLPWFSAASNSTTLIRPAVVMRWGRSMPACCRRLCL